MKEMNLNYRTGLDIGEETRIMLDSMLKSKVPGFIDCILPQFSLLSYPEYSELNRLGKKIIPWTINDKKELNVLRTMEGFPVIIRLLDPPLHEFLPDKEEVLNRIYSLKIKMIKANELKEISISSDFICDHTGSWYLNHRSKFIADIVVTFFIKSHLLQSLPENR